MGESHISFVVSFRRPHHFIFSIIYFDLYTVLSSVFCVEKKEFLKNLYHFYFKITDSLLTLFTRKSYMSKTKSSL